MSWLDKNTHSCYPPTILSVTVRWKKTCPRLPPKHQTLREKYHCADAWRRATKGRAYLNCTYAVKCTFVPSTCFKMVDAKDAGLLCDCLRNQVFHCCFLLKSTVICSHGNLRKKVAAAAMHIWQSLLAELASQNKEVIATKCLHLY